MGAEVLNSIWLATGITLFLALAWLRLNDLFAHKGLISSSLSRKIIHIGTGPIFVLCWILFPGSTASRFLAALIPLGIVIQFTLVGLGVLKDRSAVEAMSRTGDAREILKGPLFYGLVFVILTIAYWRDSMIGIIALMILCGGDGLADVVGKRWKNTSPLPWSPSKTWAGSAAMFLGGWIFPVIIFLVYRLTGYSALSVGHFLAGTAGIAFVTTVIESLPIMDIDNITVPAAAVIMGHVLSL
jgi:phytol kinase